MSTGSIDLLKNESIKIRDNEKIYFNRGKCAITHKNNGVVLWEKKYNLQEEFNQVLVFAINTNTNTLVLCDEYGDYLYLLSLEDGGLTKLLKLNRSENDDSDFYRSQFIILENGFLFVYEGGIVKLSENGNLLWSINHQYYDWVFAGVKDGLALYENEFDGKWGYMLDNGEKADNI